jgi:acetyl esterase/lipase
VIKKARRKVSLTTVVCDAQFDEFGKKVEHVCNPHRIKAFSKARCGPANVSANLRHLIPFLAAGLRAPAGKPRPHSRLPRPAKKNRAAEVEFPDAYQTHGSQDQTLDLYAPKEAKNAPLIIWIHGGAFLFGSKEGFAGEPVPLHLLFDGFAVASINYRLIPEALFPAQLEDCKAAVRWLRAHADEFGIDPNRIGVWGASAGAYLASLLGTTGETQEFDVGENLNYSRYSGLREAGLSEEPLCAPIKALSM